MFSCTGSAIQKTISGPQTKWLNRFQRKALLLGLEPQRLHLLL